MSRLITITLEVPDDSEEEVELSFPSWGATPDGGAAIDPLRNDLRISGARVVSVEACPQ